MDPHRTEMFGDDYSARLARTPKGMAHLAGTGPAGTVCKNCTFYDKANVKPPTRPYGTCRKYRQLMRMKRNTGKIPPNTPSCKYYEKP